jgi:hypothetical protein
MDTLTEAIANAAQHGAPPKVWHVGTDAAVDFGTGRNPFDGIQLTHWTRD